jgi:hypothetical protein
MNDELNWIYSLKEEVVDFLRHQASLNREGYYSYSYSGDLYSDNTHWNVGSSVFALRCYYSLGIEKNNQIKSALNYINSFRVDSLIYDKFIFKKTFFRNIAVSIKNNDLSNLLNYKYKNAETRQCLSALLMYDSLPNNIKLDIPLGEKSVSYYLNSLNWNEPWGAGSHFSHLMFFYKVALRTGQIDNNEYHKNIGYAINWINSIQSKSTGGWYTGTPKQRNIINGAMKIITGLISVDINEIEFSKQLIDTCLMSANDEHACDNFNIILVLYFLNKQMKSSYRYNEIKLFSFDRLIKYKAHYKKDKGGFSFYPYHSNTRYYGARITSGLNEPDLHGTFLFLYGISLIAEILEINETLGFKIYAS